MAPSDTDKLDDEPFGALVAFAEPAWYHSSFIPPKGYYNQTHVTLRNFMRDYVNREFLPYMSEWDENKTPPPAMYKKICKAGFNAAVLYPLPVKYMEGVTLPGGIKPEDWDAFHDFVFNDEFARVGGVGFGMALWGGTFIGLPPVINFASKEVKQEIINPVLKGDKRICLAITEPDAGSDVAGLTCTAKKTEDGKYYVVNGEKKWITTGIWSDYITTAVRTGGPGASGISVLIIPANIPGVTTRRMHTGGAKQSGSTFIDFEDVKVPAKYLLGKEGQGFKIIMTNFNHERLNISFVAHRSARVCLEDALRHASKRIAFGKPLFDLGTVRSKLAEMAKRIESQHAWIEQVVYQSMVMSKDQLNTELGGITALLKAQCSSTLEYCASQAVNIFGGLGVTIGGQGERVERLYRDCKIASIPGGAEDVMLDLAIRQQVKITNGKKKRAEAKL
ncbi:hypothetical protein YB2330_000939 [Saitoella coloradoensis]